jgi:hypothetical protein
MKTIKELGLTPLLRRISDGATYKIISGSILDANYVKAKNITGSFLTLENVTDSMDQVLYLWPYYGDREYEALDEHIEQEARPAQTMDTYVYDKATGEMVLVDMAKPSDRAIEIITNDRYEGVNDENK